MPPIIRGTNKAEIEAFLKKSNELITGFNKNGEGNFVKFKKENKVKATGIAGLSFSIVKAEDGYFYALGQRKNPNHFLGEGGYCQVKIAYRLDKEKVNGRDEWRLGEEVAVKKATNKSKLNYYSLLFSQKNQQRYDKVKSFEDKRVAKAIKNTQQAEKFYLFTKLVDGEEFQSLINKGYFNNASLSKRLRFCLSIMPELIELHDNNIVHGDLKLQNLMYSPINNQGKIVDYEYAVCQGGERPGESPYYAVPEHYTTDKASKAADIYALGLMFTILLLANSQSRIFKENETEEYFEACPIFRNKHNAYRIWGNDIRALIKTAPIIDISEHLFADSNDPAASKANLVNFLGRMTAKNPKDRPTAKEVQAYLDNFLMQHEKEVGIPADVKEIEQQVYKGMATKPMLEQILKDMKFNDYLEKFENLGKHLKENNELALEQVDYCLKAMREAKKRFLQEEAGSSIPVAIRRLQQACCKAITEADNNNWTYVSLVKNFIIDCLNYFITKSSLTQCGFTFFAKYGSQASKELNKLKEEVLVVDEEEDNQQLKLRCL